MALVICSECGKEISNKAPSCPNCGAVHHKADPQTGGPGFFVGLFKAVVSIAVGSYILTYGLNWLAHGKPPHPVYMVVDLLRQAGVPVGNLDCQSIHDDVISVSVNSAAQNDGIAIKDIVYMSTSSQSPTTVSCIGRATWSTGRNSRISYSKTFRDGQYWVQFEELPF
ncbi:zinc ribbon domain-containing protein [Mesorhizobium sp. M8A.F.Ca.ET.208.01.1.1]|uniref:zinc ribbon domain-containing protein n=1 Tax=unclassified Mesorhizobium TaxID=325217 RepID=UPI001093FF50|nr:MULTISPECIES: zinc ribbon domain-containing protein [unclassified Mesorhizobium]TGQ89964.1 zinc ribbon domain-containing protein [Mesorhizobium sp. M8A.F.Ca.ET.208.01.1.1]TGT50803.1 zinc ribbon domain-containing protein [Mesorhizobium sp. M8A.F.Ca.ET.167.01.1.1]